MPLSFREDSKTLEITTCDNVLTHRSLKGGQNWKVAIKQAIDSSRYFIPVFSSRSITKVGYSQAERKFALEVLDKFPKGEI